MKEFSFSEQKKYIETLFYFAISINIIGFVTLFYHNRSNYDPFAARDFDGFLILYIAVIIISSFTVLRLIKYYYVFQSFEYLLVAFIVYHFGFSFFLYQIYVDYIADSLIDTRNQSEMNSLGGFYYFLSQLLVAWHAIRIRGWKNSNIMTRIFMGFLIYINSIVILIGLEGELSSNPQQEGSFKIWSFEIFHRLSDQDLIYLTIPTLLTYLFVIITYLQIKVYAKNSVAKATKTVWIVFGTFIIIQRLISDNLADLDLSQHEAYQIWAFGTFIVMIVIQIILFLFPESLLITKNQILRAHNLYKIANSKEKSTGDRSRIYSTFNYQDRVATYLDSLPLELLESMDQS